MESTGNLRENALGRRVEDNLITVISEPLEAIKDLNKVTTKEKNQVELFAWQVLEAILGRSVEDVQVKIFLEAVQTFTQERLKNEFSNDVQNLLFALKCIAYNIPNLKSKFYASDFFVDLEAFFINTSVPTDLQSGIISIYNQEITNYRQLIGNFSFGAAIVGKAELSIEKNESQYNWGIWLQELDQKFTTLEDIASLSQTVEDLQRIMLNDSRFIQLSDEHKHWLGLTLKAMVLNHFAKINNRDDLQADLTMLGDYYDYLIGALNTRDVVEIINSLSEQKANLQTGRLQNPYKSEVQLKLEEENKILVEWGDQLQSQVDLLEGQVEGLSDLIGDLLLVIKGDDKYESISEVAKQNLELILQWQVLSHVGATLGIAKNTPIPPLLSAHFSEFRKAFSNEIKQVFGRTGENESTDSSRANFQIIAQIRHRLNVKTVNRGSPLKLLAFKAKQKLLSTNLEKIIIERTQHQETLNLAIANYREKQIQSAEDELIELIYVKHLTTKYLASIGAIKPESLLTLEQTVASVFILPEYNSQINKVVADLEAKITFSEENDHALRGELFQRLTLSARRGGEKGLRNILTNKLATPLNGKQMVQVYELSDVQAFYNSDNFTVLDKYERFSNTFEPFFEKLKSNKNL
jgi:hypothetical protein